MKSRKVAPAKVPHGTPRSQAQILRLVDALEDAMLLNIPRARYGKVLAIAALPPGAGADAQAEAEPLPDRTVDDYVARVTQRWKDDPLPGRRVARQRAIRRHYKRLPVLVSKGLYGEVDKLERHLSRLEGTEAAKVVHIAGEGGGPIQTESTATAVVLTSGERRARAAQLLEAARARVAAQVAEAAASDEE